MTSPPPALTPDEVAGLIQLGPDDLNDIEREVRRLALDLTLAPGGGAAAARVPTYDLPLERIGLGVSNWILISANAAQAANEVMVLAVKAQTAAAAEELARSQAAVAGAQAAETVHSDLPETGHGDDRS